MYTGGQTEVGAGHGSEEEEEDISVYASVRVFLIGSCL
jgi:hypothetical protein